MKVLVINSGSSSLKYEVFDLNAEQSLELAFLVAEELQDRRAMRKAEAV